jgi:hypothetical protein
VHQVGHKKLIYIMMHGQRNIKKKLNNKFLSFSPSATSLVVSFGPRVFIHFTAFNNRFQHTMCKERAIFLLLAHNS